MLIQVNYYLLNHWRKKIQSVFLSKHSIYRNIISEAKTLYNHNIDIHCRVQKRTQSFRPRRVSTCIFLLTWKCHGGCAILLKHNMQYVERKDIELLTIFVCIECYAIQVTIVTVTYLVVCLYRPNTMTLKRLCQILVNVNRKYGNNISCSSS